MFLARDDGGDRVFGRTTNSKSECAALAASHESHTYTIEPRGDKGPVLGAFWGLRVKRIDEKGFGFADNHTGWLRLCRTR